MPTIVEIQRVDKLNKGKLIVVRLKVWDNTKVELGMKLQDDLNREWKINGIEMFSVPRDPTKEFKNDLQWQQEGVWFCNVTPIGHSYDIERGNYELIK